MIRKELIKILETLLEQDKDYEYSQSLTHLLTDILNNNYVDFNKLDNLMEDSFNSYDQPFQKIDVNNDYTNNHYLQSYYSNEDNLKKNNIGNAKVFHIDKDKLINVLKSLLNNSLRDVSISSIEAGQNTESISNIESNQPNFLDEYPNSKLKNPEYNRNNSIKNLVYNNYHNNDFSDNLRDNISNFIKTIKLPNKSGSFRCTFIYEEINNNLNKNINLYNKNSNYMSNHQEHSLIKNDSFKKEDFGPQYNRQILENENIYSDKKKSQYPYEGNRNTEKLPLEKALQIKEKSPRTYKSTYEPKYINKYKHNFKPLKYVRVSKPSEKITSFLKSKLK